MMGEISESCHGVYVHALTWDDLEEACYIFESTYSTFLDVSVLNLVLECTNHYPECVCTYTRLYSKFRVYVRLGYLNLVPEYKTAVYTRVHSPTPGYARTVVLGNWNIKYYPLSHK
jgi:hypothetical protein